jgi:hypothetical protein
MSHRLVMNSRFFAAIIILISTSVVYAFDYLPLTVGNTWTMTSKAMSTPVTMKVISTTEANAEIYSSVEFVNPWSTVTLLLKSTFVNGIELDGMISNGSTFRFTEPSPFFPNPSSTPATGANAPTTAALVSSNLTITASGKQYTGVRLYRIRFTDGTQQSWYLAPDVGFIQFGEGPYGFILSASKISPYITSVKLRQPSTCPLIGIDANPAANGDFSQNGHEARLKQAISAGSRLLQINASWAELETAPKTYSFDRLKIYLAWAEKYNLDAVLTIKTVNSFELSVPSDLRGKPLDDATVKARFGALLTAIAPFLGTRVKWVNLANEVDIYYGNRQSEIPIFKSFFQSAATKLESLKPKVFVGLVFSYDSFRRYNATFQALEPLCKEVSFTYYALNEGFISRGSDAPANDLPVMVAAAKGRPLILTEVGSASAGSKTTAATQRDFLANVFQTLSTLGSKVTAASFYQMSDLPPAQLAAYANSYGSSSAFAQYAGSLGLHDTAGSAKLAWGEFQLNAAKFKQPSYCTSDIEPVSRRVP